MQITDQRTFIYDKTYRMGPIDVKNVSKFHKPGGTSFPEKLSESFCFELFEVFVGIVWIVNWYCLELLLGLFEIFVN